MSSRKSSFASLQGDQLIASSPANHAALSASAGTGKTHVLTARVLRLLLSGVDPAAILCLTFTKAGAAEMAERIHGRLALWVNMKDPALGAELKALGESVSPDLRKTARTLFARVLDATGGGLRIETIHAFAQSLLAAFPAEADLVPGFRPIEGREEQQLARSTLAEMLVRAEGSGDLGLVRDVQALSLRLGEGGAEAWLVQCARAPDAMADLGSRESIAPRLRRMFDLPTGDVLEEVIRACCDEALVDLDLARIARLNREWGTERGKNRAGACEDWLARSPRDRAETLADLHAVWAKADGEPRSFGKGQAPKDEAYSALAEAAYRRCAPLLRMQALAAMVDLQAAGLRAGQAFAAAYSQAKRSAGLVDFDDLIRRAEALLTTPGAGDWVRYKLDQRTDHILVDEAQDTNRRQWSIVEALAEEYFAGEGSPRGARTVFTVGDFKQAIFSFQGTNPREFEEARQRFSGKARATRHEAEQRLAEGRWRRSDPLPPDFLNLSVDLSFRSSQPLLDVVDRVLDELGPSGLGLTKAANPHRSHARGRGGSVTLWQPTRPESVAEPDDPGEESWISDATRVHAGRIAAQIRAWLDQPFLLECKGRPLEARDILVLVRRRGDLASLLVARLHALGVPVAGVDRLLLSAPLAVQDLLAAARFAIQPLDDLNLATLLVSPLFGWSQDQLHALAADRDEPLWSCLRRSGLTPPETLTGLQSILAVADFAGPHSFLEHLLSGRLQGRRRLLERLGTEARDPIEELVSSALQFEQEGSASLEAFVDWFGRGKVEIVRDSSGPPDSVRVMTVHGSKGLQSPLVILADACADPDRAGGSPASRFVMIRPSGTEAAIPFFRPRRDELAEPLLSAIEEKDRLDREEHWRLLYVALTRAQERLYVGGAPARQSGEEMPADSWYAAVERALASLGSSWEERPIWGGARRHGGPEISVSRLAVTPPPPVAIPSWALQSAPEEERPPRPLAPSAPGEDETSYPPPSDEQRRAALRGRLLHQLFERLPGVPRQDRRTRAQAWLAAVAGLEDARLRASLVDDACRIVEDDDFASFFAPGSLAEAPIAAVIEGGTVVSGTVDRLIVEEGRVLVVDFKTGRSVPAGPSSIPVSHLRQMAAYRDALRIIFPGRVVISALLYTSGPRLHMLPDTLLDDHSPAGRGSLRIVGG